MGVALVFTKSNWTREIADILKPATGEDEPIIRREVETGQSECWQIKDVGVIVTRLEVEPDSRTLVLVAGAGRRSAEVFRLLPKMAKANGAGWIRVHSKRPGMKKLLMPLGYEVTPGNGETIYLKQVQ